MGSEANRQAERPGRRKPRPVTKTVWIGGLPLAASATTMLSGGSTTILTSSASPHQWNSPPRSSHCPAMDQPLSLARDTFFEEWLLAAGRRLRSPTHQGKNSSDATIVMAAARLQLSPPLSAWPLPFLSRHSRASRSQPRSSWFVDIQFCTAKQALVSRRDVSLVTLRQPPPLSRHLPLPV